MLKLISILFIFAPLLISAAIIDGKTGNPYTNIVISDDAPASVRLAAQELHRFLKTCCNADLSVKKQSETKKNGKNIYLGQATELDFSSLKGDGFKIINDQRGLLIGGRDYSGPPIVGNRHPWRKSEAWNNKLGIGNFGETGTLYGVYYFLERFCLIRFYMPSKLGTVIPREKDILIPKCKITREPDFSYRNVYLTYMPLSEEDTLWYKKAGFGALAPLNISHSFYFFQKFRSTHPEYFALVDGKRDFDTACATHGGGHLCLTNPDVINQWVKEISDFFDKNPSQHSFGLAPMDGLIRICGCEQCQAEIKRDAPNSGKFSNHIWGFVKKVAEKIGEKYPDKIIGSIAYQTYMDPPDFKLPSNVAVMFCKASSSYLDKNYHNQVNILMEKWKSKASHFYCWEYYLNCLVPWRNLPVFYPHIISEDLKYLKKMGFSGEFIQAESWDGNHPQRIMQVLGLHHLNLYVTGKLFWDVDIDIDKLLDEYYTMFYGSAAKPMKDFVCYAERIRNSEGGSNLKGKLDWPTTRGDVKKVFTPERIKHLNNLLAQAIKLTKAGTVYRKRVELIRNEFNEGINALNPKSKITHIPIVAKVDDTLWKNLPKDEFVAPGGSKVSPPTFIQLAATKDKLYLKFTAMEPRFNNKVVAMYPKKSIWYDDYLAAIFYPKTKKFRLQIVLNKTGAYSSKYLKVITQADSSDKWWSVVVEIPCNQIKIKTIKPGISIPVNFYHRRLVKHVNRSLKCWSPTNENSINSTKHGLLQF